MHAARCGKRVCGQRVEGSDSWADSWAAVAGPVLGSEGMETSMGETCSAASRGRPKALYGHGAAANLSACERGSAGRIGGKNGRREGVREIMHRDIQHKMLHHL